MSPGTALPSCTDPPLTPMRLSAAFHQEPILDAASELNPVELRSLDALHLATVLSLGEDIERFYCYDERLAGAAQALGVEVAQPR